MTAKAKILLFIGLLFTSSILLVSGVGFSNFKSASTENKTVKLDNQAFLISKALEQKIERYFDVLNVIADEIEINDTGLLNIDKTVQSLHIIANNLGVLDVYVTTKDARTYTHQKDGLQLGFNAKEMNREWYTRAFNGEKKIVTSPYISSLGNKVTALAVPLKRNGEVEGVLALNIGIHQITGFIQDLTPENNVFVSRQDGYLLAAKEVGLIGKNIYNERPSYKEFKDKSISNHNYYLEGIEYTVSSIVIDSLNWTVWSWSSWDDINAASNKNLQVSLFIALIFIVILLSITYLIIMKVMYRPIGGEPVIVEAAVKRITQGKLNSVAPITSKETGVYSAILTLVSNLKEIVKNINVSISQLNISSAQVSESASSANDNSESQFKELGKISANMDQMAAAINDISCNTFYSSTAAEQVHTISTESINAVNEINSNMPILVKGGATLQKVICSLEKQLNNIDNQIEMATAKNNVAEVKETMKHFKSELNYASELIQINVAHTELTTEKSYEAHCAVQKLHHSISIIQDMSVRIASSVAGQTLATADINQCIASLNEIAKTTFNNAGDNTKTATELLNIATALNKSIEIFKL